MGRLHCTQDPVPEAVGGDMQLLNQLGAQVGRAAEARGRGGCRAAARRGFGERREGMRAGPRASGVGCGVRGIQGGSNGNWSVA